MGKGYDFLKEKGIFTGELGDPSLKPFHDAKDKTEFYGWALDWVKNGCCVPSHLSGKDLWLLEMCHTCDVAVQITLHYYFAKKQEKVKE